VAVVVLIAIGLVIGRRFCDCRGIGKGRSSSRTGVRETVEEVASVVLVDVASEKGDDGL